MKIYGAIALATLIFALPARADNNCRLQEDASLPMTVDNSGRIVVPMTMAGKRVNMMVDTGAILSLLQFKIAQSLGFDIKHVEIGRAGVGVVQMFGGLTITEYTKATDVAIGQLKADSMGFGIMPGNAEEGVDGLLGQDIMMNYDADFDFANGKFNLFSKDHCPGGVVYWTSTPVAVVPFSRSMWGHIIVPVQIDGKNFDAFLDTGDSRTVGNWDALKYAFGFDEKSAGVKAADDSEAGHYVYPFKTLTFGGVTVNNPDITLIPQSESGMVNRAGEPGMRMPALIVGVNVLRQLHIYVAESEKKLYITAASAH